MKNEGFRSHPDQNQHSQHVLSVPAPALGWIWVGDDAMARIVQDGNEYEWPSVGPSHGREGTKPGPDPEEGTRKKGHPWLTDGLAVFQRFHGRISAYLTGFTTA